VPCPPSPCTVVYETTDPPGQPDPPTPPPSGTLCPEEKLITFDLDGEMRTCVWVLSECGNPGSVHTIFGSCDGNPCDCGTENDCADCDGPELDPTEPNPLPLPVNVDQLKVRLNGTAEFDMATFRLPVNGTPWTLDGDYSISELATVNIPMKGYFKLMTIYGPNPNDPTASKAYRIGIRLDDTYSGPAETAYLYEYTGDQEGACWFEEKLYHVVGRK
jgi:hypothetical protein